MNNESSLNVYVNGFAAKNTAGCKRITCPEGPSTIIASKKYIIYLSSLSQRYAQDISKKVFLFSCRHYYERGILFYSGSFDGVASLIHENTPEKTEEKFTVPGKTTLTLCRLVTELPWTRRDDRRRKNPVTRLVLGFKRWKWYVRTIGIITEMSNCLQSRRLSEESSQWF